MIKMIIIIAIITLMLLADIIYLVGLIKFERHVNQHIETYGQKHNL